MSLDFPTQMRINNAIRKLKEIYPGPVAEMLEIELICWRDHGYRIGGSSLFSRLVDHILSVPLPSTNVEAEKKEEKSA